MLAPFETDSFSSNLLEQIAPLLTRLESDYYNTKLKVTINQSIVAIAVSWSNPFHPHAKYFRIYLDDSVKESNELKNQILESLEISPFFTADRFIYALMSNQVEMIHTLKTNHYELIRETYEPEWTPNHCLNELSNSAHTNTLTYKEVLQDTHLKNQLVTLLRQNYENTHLVNPTADMTLHEWETFLLNEDPNLELSLVALDDQGVTAYITVFRSNTSVEVAWVGMREAYPSSFLLLKSLFKTQLLLFEQHGIEAIEPEIDTTDHFALGLFSFMDYSDEENFQTYRKFI
ncbi:hypothetical protein [Marinilactibacillus sp. Marseille-P9653]|uniref:hypothetical protein n=1 Tax=Marinilactibacillus sp. Marseille-P9653 TaxID=2866583 RepID=UPI001CE49F42|nr:hypothetical protein [Marinilactibacillus sp. Marseille-P9653]